jgi:anti-sigma-K factor RskA
LSVEPGADVPVACSLDDAGLADRVGEWRAFVASSVTSVDAGPTAVHLVLAPSDQALVAAVALAQQEKECCPFFDVALDIAADRRTLSFRVPEGAETVLADFVALLRP